MLILLTGNDTYTLSQKLKELKAKFTRDVDQSNLNLSEVDGSALEAGTLRREVTASPFLARRRMIILNNCLERIASNPDIAEEWKAIQESLASMEVSSPIVILLEEQKLEAPKRSKKPTATKRTKKEPALTRAMLLESLPKNVTPIEAWMRTGHDNVVLAQRIAGIRGVTLSQGALECIAELPIDPWSIATLVEMTASYHGTSTTPITAKELELFTIVSTDDILFTLQDALGARDKKLLLQECREKLASGVHPLVILTTIHRTLLMLRQTLDNTLPSTVHPFVAKKIASNARKWNSLELKTIAQKAMVGDGLMKSSSGLTPETILLRLALSIN